MKKWVILSDFAVVFFIIAGVFFWNEVISQFSACPLNKLTGGYCVACGTTRMFIAIRHWDISHAFGYNPLVFSIVVYLILTLILCNIFIINGKNVHKWLLNSKMLWFWAIASVLFGILRNIPFIPFSYLAP